MDWAGIEPAASSMPRKRSTTDLPARSYLLGRLRLKELGFLLDNRAGYQVYTENIMVMNK